MRIHEILGRNVKRYREARKWSQEELAEQTGLHRTYVSGVERGIRNPTVQIVANLAAALEVEAADLLTDTEQ